MGNNDITLKEWLEDNDWDANSRGIELWVSGAQIPRNLWNETFVGPDADVELIISE